MVLAPAPLDRPFGSAQVLRYRGACTPGAPADVANHYPKGNAVIPYNSQLINTNAQFEAWVRFALFDPNFPGFSAGPTKTYPPYVYDSSQPAGGQPIGPALGNASTNPGVNATDLRVSTGETWATNVLIHENRIDSNVLIADVGLSTQNDASNTSLGIGPGAFIFQDTGASSGLGTNTGLYVACIRFVVNSTGGLAPAIQAFNVDLTFEIRHTAIR